MNQEEIALNLIKLGAVKFSLKKPFLYASGLFGPIYCDNRLILSCVTFREKIITSFINIMEEEKFRFDHLGGIATAGIPYAAFIAERLKKSMVYIRPAKKEHGKKNQVEGLYKPYEKILLFEDLVNQGESLINSLNGLKDANLLFEACLCIVDYEMKGVREKLKKQGVQLFSLTNFTLLMNKALELNLIEKDEMESLRNWHDNPKDWTP